jgi:peptidoglycan/LPS O-acetylase OafA/YrhL
MVVDIGAPTPQQTLAPLLYVQNFITAAHEKYGSQPTLGHTWSLSVEEQFYIVFPLLLLILSRRLSRMRLTIVLAYLTGCASVVRLAEQNWRQMYYGTASNACLLLLGATAAAWMTTRPMVSRRTLPIGPSVTSVVLLVVVVGAAPISFDIYVSAPLLAAILAVGLIVLLTGTDEVPGWCTPRWLTLVGRRSYGLYLWHYPLMYGVRDRLPTSPIVTCALLAAAWMLSALSWRWIERPAQRWGRRADLRIISGTTEAMLGPNGQRRGPANSSTAIVA